PGYKEGLFSIQDEAASLVSEIVHPNQDTTVIDLCAAPGGKSLHLAEMLEGKGKVIAVDIYEKRLAELKKNRTRLSLSNIEIGTGDGREFQFERLADSVLVDAPCSGTGVLNRRSDLKYRKKPEDLKELPVLQGALLDNAATLVKPGGVLVYSTCSLEPEENQAVIESFLKKWSESFKLEDLTPYLPESLKNDERLSDTAKAGMLLLHPGIRGLSGFFIARLRKAPDIEMK
ncbi:MAG TPA: methyltransferase domain-containing protein, partial [Candidatus Melainabacteria bacterium]|nr:methyltransferase domain-containing protein [Candidatus Melainabacteria bacterium]